MIRYIQNEMHYTEVVERIRRVRQYLWIGTADIKDLYVKEGSTSVPLLSVLEGLIRRGVEVRLIHAKEPGRNFADDFDKYPLLWSRLERRLCPRVHFKILVFDCEAAYIGSANLTGAGLGMKGAATRNFEADPVPAAENAQRQPNVCARSLRTRSPIPILRATATVCSITNL